jgi:hypothetical protein
MDIIRDQLASLWLASPLGVAIVLVLTIALVTGIAARIIESIDEAGWRLRNAWQQLAAPSDVTAAEEGARSARMGR